MVYAVLPLVPVWIRAGRNEKVLGTQPHRLDLFAHAEIQLPQIAGLESGEVTER